MSLIDVWIGVDNSIESMKSVLKRFTTGLYIMDLRWEKKFLCKEA